VQAAGSILIFCALLSGCGKPKAPTAIPLPFSVTGRVLLNGVPPPEIVIQMDPACEKLQPDTNTPPTTRHYVVAPNRGLANVFVSIRAEFDSMKYPVPTNAMQMSVIACQYQPYVLGARAGQPIAVTVKDSNVLDNFHFTPKMNKEFNFVHVGGQQPHIVRLDKPEDFVRAKSDVHPWMFGYICVVDHPFFAITDTNGSFALPDGLPDGTYTLEARHLKAGSQKKQITVRNGTSANVEFELTVPKR